MSFESWMLVVFVGFVSAWVVLQERVLAIIAAVGGALWVLITLIHNLR